MLIPPWCSISVLSFRYRDLHSGASCPGRVDVWPGYRGLHSGASCPGRVDLCPGYMGQRSGGPCPGMVEVCLGYRGLHSGGKRAPGCGGLLSCQPCTYVHAIRRSMQWIGPLSASPRAQRHALCPGQTCSRHCAPSLMSAVHAHARHTDLHAVDRA